MYIELIQTVTMTIATIIYSLKNIKKLSLFYGLIYCQQRVSDDDEIKKLEDQILLLESQLKLTTDTLKRVKYKITPRQSYSEGRNGEEV